VKHTGKETVTSTTMATGLSTLAAKKQRNGVAIIIDKHHTGRILTTIQKNERLMLTTISAEPANLAIIIIIIIINVYLGNSNVQMGIVYIGMLSIGVE
jgi:exonuclease III